MIHGVRSRGVVSLPEPAGRPHPEQNRAAGLRVVPQAAQAEPSRGLPQLEQNFPVVGAPQDEQVLEEAFIGST